MSAIWLDQLRAHAADRDETAAIVRYFRSQQLARMIREADAHDQALARLERWLAATTPRTHA